MIYRNAIVAAVLLTSGCAVNSNIANYPQPLAAQNLAFTYKKGFDQTRIDSVEKKVVRTYVQDAEEKISEVSGATCTMSSSEMSVKFTSPSEVQVPVIKGQPKPLQVKCTLKNLRLDQPLEAFIPQKRTETTYMGGGVAGVLLGALVNATGDAIVNSHRQSLDLWRFQDKALINIDLPLK